MNYELLTDRIEQLISVAASAPKSATGNVRAELAEYGIGPEAIAQRRIDLGIKEPVEYPTEKVREKYRGDRGQKRRITSFERLDNVGG